MSLFRKLAFCSKPPKKRERAGRKGGRDEECAVCQDIPTDPCTVPCGNNHVFCLACLQGLVRHNDYRRHFPCPLCRTRVKIPVRGLAVLKNEKDFRDRVMARLPTLKPRCHRRSQSTSSTVSSNWLPNDVLEVVIPWDHLNEVPTLDASFIEALEDVPLGRLYLDTLTRRNRILEEENLDLTDEFPLDSVDVELQRRILEEIERAGHASETAPLPPAASDRSDSLQDYTFANDNDDGDEAFACAVDHDIHEPKREGNDDGDDGDDVDDNWLMLRQRGSDGGGGDSSRSENSSNPPTLRHCANTPRAPLGIFTPRDGDSSRSESSSEAPTLRHCANTPRAPLGICAPRGRNVDREDEEEEEEGEEEEEEASTTLQDGDLDMRVVMQLITDMDRNSDDGAGPRDEVTRDTRRDTKRGVKRDTKRDAAARDATSRGATTRDTTTRQQPASEDPITSSTRSSVQQNQPNSSSRRRSGHLDEARRTLNARIRQHLGETTNTGTGNPTGASGSEEEEDWKHTTTSPAGHWIPRPKFSNKAAKEEEGEGEGERRESTPDSRRPHSLRSNGSTADRSPRRTGQRQAPTTHPSAWDRENFINFESRSPGNSPYRRRRRANSDFENSAERRELSRAQSGAGTSAVSGRQENHSAGSSSQDDHKTHPKLVARVRPVRRNHSDGHATAEDQRRRCRSESAREVSANPGRCEVAGDREYAENLRRVSSLLQPRSRLSRPDAPATHARDMAAAASAVPESESGEKDRKAAKNVTVITV